MQRLYLVPVETLWGMWVTTPEGHTWTLVPEGTEGAKRGRGPKYFAWNFHPTEGIQCAWAMMDYGYMPSALLLAQNISEADDTFLRDPSHTDVYAFPLVTLPSGLAIPIPSNNGLAAYCEGINIPTDWTTASTTYLQLLRMLAGIFQFALRYQGISGQVLFAPGVTLATRYRNLTAQQQQWFTATVESFGYPASIINANSTFRQMLKSAGDAWGVQPFFLGGLEF